MTAYRKLEHMNKSWCRFKREKKKQWSVSANSKGPWWHNLGDIRSDLYGALEGTSREKNI